MAEASKNLTPVTLELGGKRLAVLLLVHLYVHTSILYKYTYYTSILTIQVHYTSTLYMYTIHVNICTLVCTYKCTCTYMYVLYNIKCISDIHVHVLCSSIHVHVHILLI